MLPRFYHASGRWAGGAGLILINLALASGAEGANFPPIARATASPVEAITAQPIRFSSAGSIDPDGQPAALTFLWDFGDGSQSTNANPDHAYAQAGARRISLTVDDGSDTTVAFLTVYVLAPVLESAPSGSGLLALSPDDRWLWVVNPDADSVTVIDAGILLPAKVAELPVAGRPRTVAFNASGGRAYVTSESRNELWVFDAVSRQRLRTLAVGHQPYGVAVSRIDGRILVSNQGAGTVHLMGPGFEVNRILAVGDSPRAIAISADGARAYVSHFITRGAAGAVTEIDLTGLSVTRVIPLAEDAGPDTPSSGRGVPNLLSALAVEPSGLGVWVGGLKSNSGRGMFNNGNPLLPENTVRGFFGRIAVAAGAEDLDRRIDINNGDSASAIAFSANGRYAYVAHQGAGMVSAYDLAAATLIPPGDGAVVPFELRIDSGHAPQGIVVTRDGKRAFVANFLSRDVTVLDLADPANPMVLTNVLSTSEPLAASVANGKRLFYRSRAPRHSRDNYIACASCHADGSGHDGRTWDFTQRGEGLRNTTDLRGRAGLGHGPVHWTANFDEIQDFENDIVKEFGGTGLAGDGLPPNPPLGMPNAGRSADLDDLAAYLSSLTRPGPSPRRRYDGTLTPAARRGKTLFEDAVLGCVACHALPRFTDSTLTASPANYVLHDVGTRTAGSGQRLGGVLAGFDTPSLIGLWDSGPYLHDGSAATVADVLSARNPDGRHGATAGLTPSQLEDLAEYLLSLDGSDDDDPIDQDEDGISDSWERRFGLMPADPADAAEDTDGDTVSNRDEFLSGTDPTDPFSRLWIRRVWRAGGWTWLSFPTTPAQSYLLESADEAGGVWSGMGTIAGDGTEHVAPDPAVGMDQRFYRLRLATPQPE